MRKKLIKSRKSKKNWQDFNITIALFELFSLNKLFFRNTGLCSKNKIN